MRRIATLSCYPQVACSIQAWNFLFAHFTAFKRTRNDCFCCVFGCATVMVASSTPCCYMLAFPDHQVPFGGRRLEAIALLFLTRFAFPQTTSAPPLLS